MALKTIVCALALLKLSSILAVRVDLEKVLHADLDLQNRNTEDGNADLSLGPDSAECKACLEPCKAMQSLPAGAVRTAEQFQQFTDKTRCLKKCITGGSGMPVGPCRAPPTVFDMFRSPQVITDSFDIFVPRSNQLTWLGKLKGKGDSYIQRGDWAFALKQINFEGHVIVLMFKENDAKASQFFVDGRRYAGALLSRLRSKPNLFDAYDRPQGHAHRWEPENICSYENPDECCCYWQDRKFVTGYFYDRMLTTAKASTYCTGQSIDNCGENLNPNPGMVWYTTDKKTGKTTKHSD